MSCLISSSISKSCGYLVGGISEVYLTNWEEVSTINSGTTTWTTGATQAKWFKFVPEKNSGSYVDELVVNGSMKSRNHSVTFRINSKTQAALDVMDDLSLATLVACVKDRTGSYVVLGKVNGLEATVSSANSGANETEEAGILITLAGLQTESAFVYSGTLVV